jgi:tetratricopeptide (TPR) repeat protein
MRYTAERIVLACCLSLWLCALGAVAAPTAALDSELSAMRFELDEANFGLDDKKARKRALDALVDRAESLTRHFPDSADARAWHGIVLTVYAGEIGGIGALKYAKAARESLLDSLRLGTREFASGVNTSLGALYAKVPGGILGFGDHDVAEDYFIKALAADPDSLDAGYFYGEFLIEQDRCEQAASILEQALGAPAHPSRPIFDNGRRTQIEALLRTVSSDANVTMC